MEALLTGISQPIVGSSSFVLFSKRASFSFNLRTIPSLENMPERTEVHTHIFLSYVSEKKRLLSPSAVRNAFVVKYVTKKHSKSLTKTVTVLQGIY